MKNEKWMEMDGRMAGWDPNEQNSWFTLTVTDGGSKINCPVSYNLMKEYILAKYIYNITMCVLLLTAN